MRDHRSLKTTAEQPAVAPSNPQPAVAPSNPNPSLSEMGEKNDIDEMMSHDLNDIDDIQ